MKLRNLNFEIHDINLKVFRLNGELQLNRPLMHK